MNHAPDFLFAIFMLISLSLGITLGWIERGARIKRRVRQFLRKLRRNKRHHASRWQTEKADMQERAVLGAIDQFRIGETCGRLNERRETEELLPHWSR